MKQYEIWWADLPLPAGRRPVLLLSRDPSYRYLTKVLAVEVTSTVREIPVEVPLGKPEGMKRACVANCDNIRVVSVARLRERIGSLGRSRVPELKRATGYAFGWEELMDL